MNNYILLLLQLLKIQSKGKFISQLFAIFQPSFSIELFRLVSLGYIHEVMSESERHGGHRYDLQICVWLCLVHCVHVY